MSAQAFQTCAVSSQSQRHDKTYLRELKKPFQISRSRTMFPGHTRMTATTMCYARILCNRRNRAGLFAVLCQAGAGVLTIVNCQLPSK